MSRTAGQSIPKYRKHRASGQAVCTIGGKDHYLGPHDTKASKLDYDRLVAEWLAAGRLSAPLQQLNSGLTINELISAYWKFAKGYYIKNGKPTSEQGGIHWALKPLRELYGKTSAEEFGPLSLKAMRVRYLQADLSRGTVNQTVGRVVRMFKWAASEELIPASVPQALSMVVGLRRGRTEARETAPVLPVDDAIVEQTLEHLPEIVADMVRLQRYAGMRPSEVCMIRPCDIDRSGEVWLYRPEAHKTEHHGRDRVVSLGPKAQGVLLSYLVRDPKTYCFRPCDSEAKRRAEMHAVRKTPVSCGNVPGSNRKHKTKRSPGVYYDTGAYRRAIHRACDKAFPHPKLGSIFRFKFTVDEKLELREWQSNHRWSPNRLRHSAGTEVRREFGLEAAQVVLGHSRADVTQIYAERDSAKAVEVARQIG
jgi:integrase